MIGTNVNINKKAQELLIKAAAKRQISVETLASEILNESIQNKFFESNTDTEKENQNTLNPLENMQPYAYYADPEQSAIPLEDWDLENYDEQY
jgi:hypothetical protein